MPHRYLWKKLRDFFIYRVLHVNDTPPRIALGVAVGIFVTWTPTIGLQMILTVLVCWLLRANKAVGVPFVWISNPLTIVPIYYPNYMVGCWLLGGDYTKFNLIEALGQDLPEGWWAKMTAWWSHMGEALWHVFAPLWVGSMIVGLVLGAITYPAIYYAVIAYRKRRHRRHPALADTPPEPSGDDSPRDLPPDPAQRADGSSEE